MTTGATIRRTMLEALLALVLNIVLGALLFATKQTWLLPSQANASGILQLAGGDPSQASDLGLRGLELPRGETAPKPGATPASPPKTDLKDLLEEQSQPSRNASPALEFLSDNPWLSLVAIVLVFPLGEELVFRGLPLLILWLTGRRQTPLERARLPWAWPLGAAAAVLFSLAHGVGSSGFHFPLPQLLLGLWLWWVATRRGLPYSVLAHATYNLVPGLFVLLAASFAPR